MTDILNVPMALPIHPSPFSDEWLGSWFRRLAEANDIPLKRLLQRLGINATYRPPQGNEQIRLAEAGALSRTQFDQLLVQPEQALTTIGIPGTAGLLPFMGVTYLQVCPTCLDTDETPYIRRYWLYRESVECQVHGGPLLDNCPHCRSALQLVGSRRSQQGAREAQATSSPLQRKRRAWRQARQQKLWLTHQFRGGSPDWGAQATPDPRHCQVCLRALSTPETDLVRLPSPDLFTNERSQTGSWHRFIDALALMIEAFAVIDFTSLVGHSRLSSKYDAASMYEWPERSNKRSNMKTARDRFSAALLLRLALMPEGNQTGLETVRPFAAALCNGLQGRPTVTASRWKYLKWLTYALHTSSQIAVLETWPGLVTAFREVKRDPATLSPPVDLTDFRLTEEQWALVDPHLNGVEHGYVYRRRDSLEAFCLKMALDRPLEQVGLDWIHNAPTRWQVEYWIEGWTEEGLLAPALERLYVHLTSHQPQPDLFGLNTDPDAEPWQRWMCAVFLSDQCIDLLVQHSTAAATDILEQLGAKAGQPAPNIL